VAARVRSHVFEQHQRLELPAPHAFAFFSDARNLEAITPPWLRFAVLHAGPIEMRPGALIDYRLTLHGLPLRWRTRIAVWEPPAKFVDVQVEGPYAQWEHTHTFAPAGERAVVIGDRVRYALPLGPLGAIAHRLFVRRDVERIFAFRRRALAERL
jgi:ligand-binding SRPBCC domain-containing protein